MRKVPFELNGMPELVRRGFLDVSIAITPAYVLRLVGVHLKSKLPIPEGEALVRRMEAQLLREHLDGILGENPQVQLLVYGDFNETREEAAIHAVQGSRGALNALHELAAQDGTANAGPITASLATCILVWTISLPVRRLRRISCREARALARLLNGARRAITA